MKKMLLVLALIAFASLTLNAQSFNYTFQDTAHNNYCDGIHLTMYNTGGPNQYADGYHEYVNACGFGSNAPQTGFKSSISALQGDWTKGGIAATADYILDFSSGIYYGCSLALATNLKPLGNNGRWEYFTDCGGGPFLLNYGFLRQGLPPAKVAGPASKLSIGLTKSEIQKR